MMILQRRKILTGDKYFFRFTPTEPCPENLELTIKLEDLAFEGLKVIVQIYHELLGEQKEDRRFVLAGDDFRMTSEFNCRISTGDFVSKFAINFYYPEPVGTPTYCVTIAEYEKYEFEGEVAKLYSFIHYHEPINFLQELRTLSPQNFVLLLSQDLDPLETRIDKASGKGSGDFYKWCLADTIIKSAGTGRIPLEYLDLAAKRYADSYAKIKNQLGFREIKETYEKRLNS